VKRDPIEDRWKSTLWENNPELLEYTSSLERKLKIAVDFCNWILTKNRFYSDQCKKAREALSAINED